MAATIVEWTGERVEVLKTLWMVDGLSARVIADRLGTSRNAAIGKLKREGLLGIRSGKRSGKFAAPRVEYRKSKARPAKRRPPQRQHIKFGGKAEPRPPRQIPVPGIVEGAWSEYLPATFFKGTLALREGVCRWPFGDPKRGVAYCGRHANGSYCPHHHRRAHRLP